MMSNTTLGVAVETLRKNVGFQYFLVPLLVGTVLYAALKKIKILGENDELLITISFAVAFLISLIPQFSDFIANLLPYFLGAAVVLFALVMVFMFFGTSEKEIVNALKKPASYIFLIILTVVLVFYVVSIQFGEQFSPYGNQTGNQTNMQVKIMREIFANPKFLGIIILLTLMAITAYMLSRQEK